MHLKFSLIKYKKKSVTECKTGDQNKIPQIITLIIHSLNIMKFSPLLLCPRHTIQISLQMRVFCSGPFGVVDSYSWRSICEDFFSFALFPSCLGVYLVYLQDTCRTHWDSPTLGSSQNTCQAQCIFSPNSYCMASTVKIIFFLKKLFSKELNKIPKTSKVKSICQYLKVQWDSWWC